MSGSKVLARGRIRVDARRAVAKLRDHLLIDLHGYAQEVARAAIMGGASVIEISYDADDVYIAFDGKPPARNALPRLLDYVFDPGADEDGARLRRLASAVNAALGLDPSFVALYSHEASDTVRFELRPELLEQEGEAAPEVGAHVVSPPLAIGDGRHGAHLRRRFGWSVVRSFFAGSEPREIELLTRAAARSPIPIMVHGEDRRPPSAEGVVLRVPIRIPGAVRGMVEVRCTGDHAPVVDVLEHGVQLVTIPFFPSAHAAFGQRFYETYPPVGGFVDAEDLPTNASRSALRADDPFLLRLREAVDVAFEEALLGVRAMLRGEDLPEDVELISQNVEDARRAAGALVCVALGMRATGHAVPASVEAFLDEPLFLDAAGCRRAANELVALAERGALYVLYESEPLEPELHAWCRNVVLVRGRVEERVLADLHVIDGRERVERAKIGAERRAAHRATWAGHAGEWETPPPPTVTPTEDTLVHERFAVEEGPTKGLVGEVMLTASALAADPPLQATVTVHIDGPPLETLTIDRSFVPLPVHAAIAWDTELAPTIEFDGVERGPALEQAIVEVARVAALAAVDLLGSIGGPDVQRAVRGALLTLPDLADDEALDVAPVWQLSDGGTHSTKRLQAYAKARGALCFVSSDARPGRAADGRPVVVLAAAERQAMQRLFPDVVLIPYEPGLVARRSEEIAGRLAAAFYEALGASDRPPVLVISERRRRAWVAPSAHSTVLLAHAGRQLGSTSDESSVAPVVAVLDDDLLLPNPDWSGVLGLTPNTAWLERALFVALCAAASGDAAAQASFSPPIDDSALRRTDVRRFLCRAATSLAKGQDREDVSAALDRMKDLRVLRVLDEHGKIRRRTPAHIRELHPDGRIPFVTKRPPFPTYDWLPVFVQSNAEMQYLESCFNDLHVVCADAELPMRERRAALVAIEQQILARPKEPRLDPTGAAGPVIRFVGGENGAPDGAYRAAIGIRSEAEDIGLDIATFELRYRGRRIGTEALDDAASVTGVIDVDDRDLLDGFERLSDAGRNLAIEVVQEAARAITSAISSAESGPLPTWWLGSGNALSVLRYADARGRRREVVRALKTALWPTVQGGTATFKSLSRSRGAPLFGLERFPSWHAGTRASSLDEPIAWIPHSRAAPVLYQLLERMGHTPRDVTEALHRLQARRASKTNVELPRLESVSLHPDLRIDLMAAGATGLVGEIQILSEGPSEVLVVDIDGAGRKVPCSLPVPIQAIARSELGQALTIDELVRELGRITLAHVSRLAPKLDALPLFVRGHLRRVVLDCIRAGRVRPKGLDAAPLFVDIRGQYHSAEALLAKVLPMPYSTVAPDGLPSMDGEPILFMSHVEARDLGAAIALLDETEHVQRVAASLARRHGAPLTIELPEELRARCLRVGSIDSGGLTGELGLLAADAAARRRIVVCVGGRNLCALPESGGWPVAAIVDGPDLAPNRYFDALEQHGQQAAVITAVKDRARELLIEHCCAPIDAFATCEVRLSLNGVEIVGSMWLPVAWPRSPTVECWLPLRQSSPESRTTSRPVPVGARIAVLIEPKKSMPWAAMEKSLLELGARLFNQHAERLRGQHPDVEVLYRWDFALAGADVAPPEEASASGAPIALTDVLADLRERGAVWVTDRAGSVDGAFPDGAPAVVLVEGSPLAQVLTHRARVRRLGEVAAQLEPATAPEQEGMLGGLLGGLKRSVLRLVEEPVAPAEPDDPGVRALFEALSVIPGGLRPTAVHFVDRGDPVRYRPDGSLVIRRGLLDRSERIISIAAAVLSEMNRSTGSMTDADERRALVGLLRQFPLAVS